MNTLMDMRVEMKVLKKTNEDLLSIVKLLAAQRCAISVLVPAANENLPPRISKMMSKQATADIVDKLMSALSDRAALYREIAYLKCAQLQSWRSS